MIHMYVYCLLSPQLKQFLIIFTYLEICVHRIMIMLYVLLKTVCFGTTMMLVRYSVHTLCT